MYKRSRHSYECFTETVKLNNALYELLRQQLIVSDDRTIMFGDDEIKSPGQLGLKVMQLINYVKESNPKKEYVSKKDQFDSIY